MSRPQQILRWQSVLGGGVVSGNQGPGLPNGASWDEVQSKVTNVVMSEPVPHGWFKGHWICNYVTIHNTWPMVLQGRGLWPLLPCGRVLPQEGAVQGALQGRALERRPQGPGRWVLSYLCLIWMMHRLHMRPPWAQKKKNSYFLRFPGNGLSYPGIWFIQFSGKIWNPISPTSYSVYCLNHNMGLNWNLVCM